MSLDLKAVADLRSGFVGELLLPGEFGYDEARHLWNGIINRYPAAIAQCTRSKDDALAIAFSHEPSLPRTIKGGGHGVADKAVCDGGLMIDCSPMNTSVVDPIAQTATAGGGVTWGQFDTAPTSWIGDHRRRCGINRYCRADPRWRYRFSHAETRTELRQPDRSRGCHCGRRIGDSE